MSERRTLSTLLKTRYNRVPEYSSISTGYIGSAGDQGYTGSRGYTGSVGYVGSQGSSGTQGIDGYTGSQGLQGIIGYTGSAGSGGGGGAGVTTYDTVANLPVSGSNGDLSYVIDTKSLYVWNGAIWFRIMSATTANQAPQITTGPNLWYNLATDGTPTVITVAGQDPEGAAITWSYTITDGTVGSTATIVQADNVFTITPSTNTANAGSFEMTITASDGVNIANARTQIKLRFQTEDFGYGVILQNTTLVPDYDNPTNAYFGKAVASYAGVFAVSGLTQINGVANTDSANSVYIFDTTQGSNPVLVQTISSTASNEKFFGENNLIMYGDMLLIPYTYFDGSIYTKAAKIFYKNAITGLFELTQLIHMSAGNWNYIGTPQAMSISGNGLVMAIGNNNNDTGTGTPELMIYTRDTVLTTTWTLRQTISGTSSFGSLTNSAIFPGSIKISETGRHIALSSPNANSGNGWLAIFTNEDILVPSYQWSITYSEAAAITTPYSMAVACTTKSDDIFYTLDAGNNTSAATHILNCKTYDSATSAWTTFPYNSMGARVLGWGQQLRNNHASFMAIPGRDGTDEIVFASVSVDPVTTTICNLVIIRAEKYNLTITNPAGSLNSFVNNGDSNWVTVRTIENPGNQLASDLYPYLTQDIITGKIYVSHRGVYGGISNAGAVFQFEESHTSNNYQAKDLIVSNGTSTIVVPDGVTYIHGICIGGGGGAGGDGSSTSSSGPGGGGALRWIMNYPVVAGDVITVVGGNRGAGGAKGPYNGATGGVSSIAVNGTIIVQANGGGGGLSARTATFSGGSGGTGTTTGTLANGATIGGGNGGNGGSTTSTGRAAGGGGAGGYYGNGGNGGNSSGTGGSGAYGGGGGGGGRNSGSSSASRGGAVGIHGIGSSGSGGDVNGNPENGSDFGEGVYGEGGGGFAGSSQGGGQPGGYGATRILLGDRFVFGSTNETTSLFVRPLSYTGT